MAGICRFRELEVLLLFRVVKHGGLVTWLIFISSGQCKEFGLFSLLLTRLSEGQNMVGSMRLQRAESSLAIKC